MGNIVDVPGMATGNRIYNHQHLDPDRNKQSGRIFSAIPIQIKTSPPDYDKCPDCGGKKIIPIKIKEDGKRTKYTECKTCKVY